MPNSVDTHLSRALANTSDPSSELLVNDIANNIIKKISSLPEVDKALLSNSQLDRLIEDELSRLSDAELARLAEPFFSSLFDALHTGIAGLFTDLGEQLYREVVAPASTLLFWGFVGMISINCGRYIYQRWSKKRLQSSKVTTNDAKQEQQKPLKESIFMSKYITNPYQGLKCVGKIYIQVQETTMDVRQEVEQHQEGTSRAFVPSSRSTGEEKRIRWREVCSEVDKGNIHQGCHFHNY